MGFPKLTSQLKRLLEVFVGLAKLVVANGQMTFVDQGLATPFRPVSQRQVLCFFQTLFRLSMTTENNQGPGYCVLASNSKLPVSKFRRRRRAQKIERLLRFA